MQSIQYSLKQAFAQLSTTSSSARLDAEILIAHVIQKDRSYIHTWPEKKLSSSETSLFHHYVNKRKSGTPIAYLTGKREFWSREFKVSPNVLIPRPETELLIELALPSIPKNGPSAIAELGTGSGAIAITLAAERPEARILAGDICKKALQLAKTNASLHQVNNIQFCLSNWFSNFPVTLFDLIISNPPYIANDDPHLNQGDVRFEPVKALKSGPNGLDALSLIAEQARDRLKPEATLLLEHGHQHSNFVFDILHPFGYKNITSHRDLQDHLRVTRAEWRPQILSN